MLRSWTLCMNNGGKGEIKMLVSSCGAQVREVKAAVWNDWGVGYTPDNGGVLQQNHGRCINFCLIIRILGWDYLMYSIKSLCCATEWHDLLPDTEKEILGTAFVIIGMWVFTFPLANWHFEETGNRETDQPFSYVLSQVWVYIFSGWKHRWTHVLH